MARGFRAAGACKSDYIVLLAPVRVPVFLKDTGKALAPGSWIMRPTKLEVTFGSPILSSALQNKGTGKLPRERIVSALHEAVWQLDPRQQAPLRSKGVDLEAYSANS